MIPKSIKTSAALAGLMVLGRLGALPGFDIRRAEATGQQASIVSVTAIADGKDITKSGAKVAPGTKITVDTVVRSHQLRGQACLRVGLVPAVGDYNTRCYNVVEGQ